MARVVRVLPDVPALDREFDYTLGDQLNTEGSVAPGTMVRVPLSGRRVGGWVTAVDVDPAVDRELSEVTKVVGRGPTPEVIELCRWTAWRWAGRLPTIMRLASPERVVPFAAGGVGVPSATSPEVPGGSGGSGAVPAAVTVLETSPTTPDIDLVGPLLGDGPTIVVVPSVVGVERLVRQLRSAGHRVARWPRDWALATTGAHVVGGRSAVFAPVPGLARVVVLDEHDDALQSESSPTWNAREVAVERTRRAGVECVLASPCPSLPARYCNVAPAERDLPVPPTTRLAPAQRRLGWAPLTVVDRRGSDSREGLYSPRLVEMARSTARDGGTVVCVLNRTGRAKLLVCRSCGTTATCARCGAAAQAEDEGVLVCRFCGAQRPHVCAECGSSALSLLRIGVSRAREELEALMMEPVVAITADVDERWNRGGGQPRVIIGTSAALHRIPHADLVAFVDFDQELLAHRYRAAEEALALVVLANRVLEGRFRGGRMLVQTRSPDHEVVQAALRGDPSIVAEAEAERRSLLGYPPFGALAVIGGPAAPEMIERFEPPLGVGVHGPSDGSWLLRSDEHGPLLDALAVTERPSGRLRLWVDPVRLR